MRLIGSGRAADVYDIGDGKVLRRYRRPGPTAKEAMVMAHARAAGFPVPEVHDHTDTDLVLDRLDGPTMLADLGKRPWRFRTHARLLADLHARLGRIPAPPGLDAPLGEGDRLVHLDLHPDNVLLTPEGPMVIDWPNAARGPAAADAAYTWVILATSDVDGFVERTGQQLFAGLFRRAAPRLAEYVPAAVTQRLADRNLHGAERERLARLVA